MAIAKVNFYWKGKFVEAGTDAPEDAPKHVLVDEPNKVNEKSLSAHEPKPKRATKEKKLKLDKK